MGRRGAYLDTKADKGVGVCPAGVGSSKGIEVQERGESRGRAILAGLVEAALVVGEGEEEVVVVDLHGVMGGGVGAQEPDDVVLARACAADGSAWCEASGG